MNGDTVLAELLSVALRQRDQAVEHAKQLQIRVNELEAAGEPADTGPQERT